MRDYSPVDKIVDNYNEKIFEGEYSRIKLKFRKNITAYSIKQALIPKLEKLNKKAMHIFTYKELGINIFASYSKNMIIYNETWQDEFSGIVLEYKNGWGFYTSYDTRTQKYYLIND